MHTYPVGLQNHMATFMAISDEHLSEPWSAWTAIGITELAISDAHVEIRVPLDYLNKKNPSNQARYCDTHTRGRTWASGAHHLLSKISVISRSQSWWGSNTD
jgi:hypothetical protein